MENTFNNVVMRVANTFIDDKAYRACAQSHRGVRMYAADFLINPRRETFKNIFEEIINKAMDKFNIIICLSTIYDNGYNDNWDYERLSKKELIQLLKVQENDMKGEALLYVNNVELTKYWDIIIFDDTYSWTYVLTHEDDVEGSRLCYSQVRL